MPLRQARWARIRKEISMQTEKIEKDNIILELVRDAFRMTFAAIGADRVVQRSLFPSDWKERYNSRLSGTKAYADKLYSRMSYICKGDDVCEMLYGFIKDSSYEK